MKNNNTTIRISRTAHKMTNKGHVCSLITYTSYLVMLAHLLCPTFTSEITVITEGCHFMLTYPENFPNQCQFLMTLTPVLPSDSHVTFISVNISVPALNINRVTTITPGAPTSISLRESGLSPYPTTSASHSNAVFVDVTVGKLSIIGTIKCEAPSESQRERRYGEFLAVPIEFWGTRYIIMAPYELSCGYTTTILTTGFETKVTLTLSIRHLMPSGYVDVNDRRIKQNSALVLAANSITNIFAEYTDITGTILESDYPIGVLVGPKNKASLSDAFCSYNQGLFIEQLIPTYAWGKRYYLNNGFASSEAAYNYDIRVVTSLADTILYLYYLNSFENQTIHFKTTQKMAAAGSSYIYNATDDYSGFDMIAADSPILVSIYITSRVKETAGDGAMMQAVMAKFWPERIVLRLTSKLGQRIHLFTDSACISSLADLLGNLSYVSNVAISLNYGKQGVEFYVPSITVVPTETQMVVSVNTSIQGCTGITAFTLNDVNNGYYILGACPNFWSVECNDGKYFDLEKKLCTTIQTTPATKPTFSTPPTTTSATSVKIEKSEAIRTTSEITVTIPTDTAVLIETRAPSSVTSLMHPDVITHKTSATEVIFYSQSVTSVATTSPFETTLTLNGTTLASNGRRTESTVFQDVQGTIAVASESVIKPLVMDSTFKLQTRDTITPPLVTTSLSYNCTGSTNLQDRESTKCPCMCQSRYDRITQFNQFNLHTTDYLKLSGDNLSKRIRSLSSAADWRPSSVGIGVGGIVVLSCLLLLLILPTAADVKNQLDNNKD